MNTSTQQSKGKTTTIKIPRFAKPKKASASRAAHKSKEIDSSGSDQESPLVAPPPQQPEPPTAETDEAFGSLFEQEWFDANNDDNVSIQDMDETCAGDIDMDPFVREDKRLAELGDPQGLDNEPFSINEREQQSELLQKFIMAPAFLNIHQLHTTLGYELVRARIASDAMIKSLRRERRRALKFEDMRHQSVKNEIVRKFNRLMRNAEKIKPAIVKLGEIGTNMGDEIQYMSDRNMYA